MTVEDLERRLGELTSQVQAALNLRGDGTAYVTRGPEGMIVGVPSPMKFLAKITTNYTDGSYAWSRVWPDLFVASSPPGWTVAADDWAPLSGDSTTWAAWEANGNTSVPVGTFVWIEAHFETGTTAEQQWRFWYCCTGASSSSQYKRTILTVGSSNFTTQSWTTRLRVYGTGPGGGGGGADSNGSSAAAAGGGSSGGYVDKTWTGALGSQTYAYTVGAKGSGGAAGSHNGSDGAADTTFTGPTTITAKKGKGGNFGGAVSGSFGVVTVGLSLGGIQAGASTNGDVNGGGNPGANGIAIIDETSSPSPILTSGAGGCSHFGGAGAGTDTEAVGDNAVANTGSGGGGAGAIATSKAGGNGADGLLVCEEWNF